LAVRRHALTLTELLVVMAVLIILVSAVVVAVVRLAARGPVAGTKGLLEKLAVGLESYRSTYQMYPPEDNVQAIGKALVPDQVQDSYQRSSWVVWYALEYQGQGEFMTPVSAAYKAAGGTFTDPTTLAAQTWYYYQDAWQQPIRYVCVSPYNQFTLTSGGPDLTLGTADDISVP
jgi:Tfp pilus assembly protein PilE